MDIWLSVKLAGLFQRQLMAMDTPEIDFKLLSKPLSVLQTNSSLTEYLSQLDPMFEGQVPRGTQLRLRHVSG